MQEQDSEKVLLLVQELNQLLDEHPTTPDLPKMIEEQLEKLGSQPPTKRR